MTSLLRLSVMVVVVWLIAIVLTPTLSFAAEPEARLEPAAGWHAVFGDTRIDWPVRVHSERPLNAVLSWTCRLGPRTIAQGETPVPAAAGDSETKIPLSIPTVNDGVILAAELSLTLRATVGKETLATATEPIWIFSRDPFFDRSEWLAALSIRLFDPARSTDAVLTEAGVPYELLTSASAIEELNEGVLIVGEGVSLATEKELPAILLQAARRGVLVLALAPSEGEVELPADLDRLRNDGWSIRFGSANVIRELDKRLAGTAWCGESQIVSAGLGLGAGQEQLLLKVTDQSAGWPWIELEGPILQSEPAAVAGTDPNAEAASRLKGGRLIVCGFGVIKHWDCGPTPRYLFARALERLALKPAPARSPVETEEK